MAIDSDTLRSFLAVHIDNDAGISFHLKDVNVVAYEQIQALHNCSLEVYDERTSRILMIDLDFIGYVEVNSTEILLTED